MQSSPEKRLWNTVLYSWVESAKKTWYRPSLRFIQSAVRDEWTAFLCELADVDQARLIRCIDFLYQFRKADIRKYEVLDARQSALRKRLLVLIKKRKKRSEKAQRIIRVIAEIDGHIKVLKKAHKETLPAWCFRRRYKDSTRKGKNGKTMQKL